MSRAAYHLARRILQNSKHFAKMPVNEQHRPNGGVAASTDISTAQQTLYDYWRTLLMEEERNAVRNERLLRKLEDIEQRTNLLYHRTERLSQLRRRFAEMLRQHYLNEPDFKYENCPFEFQVYRST
ncbi:hypothetical protein BIW11_13740 [Tropilaelaps mercedesae]|uniref:Uncharacterized protein n=1 Tax=Tropilaelaps mercedesae TaxID=418985 RepID=A0A1V9X0X7_9ACAR|nr:hypothetical protein BIW11_13740 [Tropilaelaps mercedesae]